MKKILVASDFSSCASNAMDYAMHMAKVLKIEVHVIHAIGTTEGVFNNTYNALYIDDYYKNKRQALAEWAKTFTDREELSGIPVQTVAEVGSVSSVLTKYMTENEIELLVMGTMGGTGISGLFGSNTSTMVEKTKTPMLIVPLETKFSMNPVITLATDFAYDFSSKDISALSELLEAFGSNRLTVLNVVEGPDWKKNESGEDQIKKSIAATRLDFVYIKESNPIEGIMNFVVSNNTDILCVVKRHHNIIYRIFNKSTVNQVMNRSIKAILVLHD
jgi:nucleotide-binding universal stress UspA family protein